MDAAPQRGQVVELGPEAGFPQGHEPLRMLVDRWYPMVSYSRGRGRTSEPDQTVWGYLTGWNVETGTNHNPYTYQVKLEGLRLVSALVR